MFTPKHKQSMLGYARPNKNRNRHSNDLDSSHPIKQNNTKSQSTSNLIYNALMSQISQDHSNYMRRLERQCSQRKSQNHLRSKTIKTVGSSPMKDHSPQGNSRVIITPSDTIKQYHTTTPKIGNSSATVKNAQRFFSKNYQERQSNTLHEDNEYLNIKQDKFLNFIDNYVVALSREQQKQSISSRIYPSQDVFNKLALYEYKLKQMEQIHDNQLKKLLKKEKLMKNKMAQMGQQIIDLTIRLKHQHQQRRRFERLFLEHQKQLKMIQNEKNKKDFEISSFCSKDYDFSINSEIEEEIEFENYRRYEKSSIGGRQRHKGKQREKQSERQCDRSAEKDRESEAQMNTSQKISRFLRKPFNDGRSTKPGASLSDEEQLY